MSVYRRKAINCVCREREGGLFGPGSPIWSLSVCLCVVPGLCLSLAHSTAAMLDWLFKEALCWEHAAQLTDHIHTNKCCCLNLIHQTTQSLFSSLENSIQFPSKRPNWNHGNKVEYDLKRLNEMNSVMNHNHCKHAAKCPKGTSPT